MGSVGDCFDNAMCESFFATLECELLNRGPFKTQVEARMALFDFIEGFYNPHRRHSALGYLSPIEYERIHRDDANQTTRRSTALRTAWPPKPAGAVQGAAVSDSKPVTLSGPLSSNTEERTEKLLSNQSRHGTVGEIKPMT